jgi:hypothetical protein
MTDIDEARAALRLFLAEGHSSVPRKQATLDTLTAFGWVTIRLDGCCWHLTALGSAAANRMTWLATGDPYER